MKILVTGANGFVGAALCRRLAEEGHRICGLVRKTSDLSLLEGTKIELYTGAMEDPDSLKTAVQDVELVFHAASAVSDWGTLDWFRKVNVEGTRNLLETSGRAGVRRLVYVSTVAVHSFIGGRNMDENAPQLPTPFPYCMTKRETEVLVRYAGCGPLETTIVRPGDVFGPGDRVSLLKMVPLLEAGRMAYIHGGKTLGAFTYVENLAEGLVLAGMNERAAGETYIITDGIELTWRQYFEKLTDALEVPRPRFSVHPVLADGLAIFLESIYRVLKIRSRPPLTRYLVAHLRRDFHFSTGKAARELGYQPRTGIDEAIQKTAVWYRKVVRGEG